MKRRLIVACTAAALIALAAGPTNVYVPGSRTQILSQCVPTTVICRAADRTLAADRWWRLRKTSPGSMASRC